MEKVRFSQYSLATLVADLITALMIGAVFLFSFQDFAPKHGLPQLLGLIGVFIYLLVSISPVIAGSILIRRLDNATVKTTVLFLQALAAIVMLLVITRATPPKIIVKFEGALFAQVPFYLIFASALILLITDVLLRRHHRAGLLDTKDEVDKKRELTNQPKRVTSGSRPDKASMKKPAATKPAKISKKNADR